MGNCCQSKPKSPKRAVNSPPVRGAAGGVGIVTVDQRLEFDTFRDFYEMAKLWRSSVILQRHSAAEKLLKRFIKNNPDRLQLYTSISGLDISDANEATVFENAKFKNLAAKYIKLFDDVITEVEANASNVDVPCAKLVALGNTHKRHDGINSGSFQAMEEPFLSMVSDALQDRYNDKAETLFRKFFQFCLKYITEGYSS